MYIVQIWEAPESEEEEAGIEVSVVRKGSHGTRSWGWPSDDKIILLDDYNYSDHIIEHIKAFAHQLCKELNS